MEDVWDITNLRVRDTVPVMSFSMARVNKVSRGKLMTKVAIGNSEKNQVFNAVHNHYQCPNALRRIHSLT